MRKFNKPYSAVELDSPFEGIEEEHGSFGLLSFSRITHGRDVHLFGSSIRHHETIVLRLKTCKRHRHLGRYWYHDEEELMEVEMTQGQFVDLITTMNAGCGTPVTIKHVLRERIDQIDHENETTVATTEFQEKLQETADQLEGLEELVELLNSKGAMKVSEKKRKLLDCSPQSFPRSEVIYPSIKSASVSL